MSIEQIDPADDVRLAEAYEVVVASAIGEYDTPYSWHEFTVSATTPDPWTEHVLLLARDGRGEPCGAADVALPCRDNTGYAWLESWFGPDWVSSTLADELIGHVRELVRARDRQILAAEATWDLETTTSPERDLLERHGFELGIEDGHRILDLPADPAALDRLAADAARHHDGYSLQTWCGRCPEEWVEEYARLRARLLEEAPRGEMQYGAEDFDADRVRHEEDDLAAQDRVSYTTVAWHADRTLAGHSQLIVPGTDPANAYQWDTLVLPEHRGHRLGVALKARNLHQAGAALGTRSRLHTWNAVENGPMVAVNEQLGYRLVEYVGEFQCRL